MGPKSRGCGAPQNLADLGLADETRCNARFDQSFFGSYLGFPSHVPPLVDLMCIPSTVGSQHNIRHVADTLILIDLNRFRLTCGHIRPGCGHIRPHLARRVRSPRSRCWRPLTGLSSGKSAKVRKQNGDEFPTGYQSFEQVGTCGEHDIVQLQHILELAANSPVNSNSSQRPCGTSWATCSEDLVGNFAPTLPRIWQTSLNSALQGGADVASPRPATSIDQHGVVVFKSWGPRPLCVCPHRVATCWAPRWPPARAQGGGLHGPRRLRRGLPQALLGLARSPRGREALVALPPRGAALGARLPGAGALPRRPPPRRRGRPARGGAAGGGPSTLPPR